MAFSVTALASSMVHREMALRTGSKETGATLKASSPKVRSTGVRAVSAAASPHMLTLVPVRRAVSSTWRTRRSTAGWK